MIALLRLPLRLGALALALALALRLLALALRLSVPWALLSVPSATIVVVAASVPGLLRTGLLSTCVGRVHADRTVGQTRIGASRGGLKTSLGLRGVARNLNPLAVVGGNARALLRNLIGSFGDYGLLGRSQLVGLGGRRSVGQRAVLELGETSVGNGRVGGGDGLGASFGALFGRRKPFTGLLQVRI